MHQSTTDLESSAVARANWKFYQQRRVALGYRTSSLHLAEQVILLKYRDRFWD